jgi:hypothetical protein
MKNYFTLLFFVLSFSLFSQNSKLETGEYSSTTPAAESLKMILSDNNKFQLSILSGTYEVVNDSVYFKTSYDDTPKFVLEYSNPNPKSDKITIDLGENSYYRFYNVYVGIQKTSDAAIEYKTIKELLNIADDFDYERKQLSFEIDKSSFIYFVEENLYKETVIEKYQIPNNVSQIKVTYYSNDLGRLNLKGFYDQANKELIVSEGKIPLKFSLNKDIKKDIIKENPIEKRVEKYWTYPGKKEIDNYDYAVDSTAVGVGYADEVPKYVFKLKIEKTLVEAQKEASKYPNKMLVVFYDTNKNAQKEFDQYIEDYQNSNQYYMYDKYNPEYDNFNFYLATEKDKNSLKKLGIIDNQSIIFFNSDGVKLYHTKAKINDDNFSYYNMSTIFSELKLINSYAKLDDVVLNKKKTISQFKQELVKITSSGRSTYASSIPPPAVPVETIGEVQVVEDRKENATQDFPVVEVDSATAAFQDYSYYDILKEKNNLYKLKSKPDEVNAKYKNLLDFHQNDKAVDADLVTIIINELRLSAGFSGLLFNDYNKELNANDYKAIDYLLKFFNEIPLLQSEILGYQFRKDYLLESISMALGRTENKNQIDKVLNYFDKTASISSDNIWVLKNKMIFLKENKLDVQYLNTFNTFYKSYIKDDSSIIEQLDKKYNPDVDYSWFEYKSSFANDLNTAAWYVVEKVKNTNLDILSNAIKWSETSLKLEKDNYYYLDTLAQLYYLNGQKDLGILTEQKAIDAALLSSDSTLIEEYKAVLEKMKNGTY